MRFPTTARVLAVVLMALAAFAGSRAVVSLSQPDQASRQPVPRAPKPIDEINSIINGDAGKGRFNGVVHGWRLAPHEVLKAEGSADRNLPLSCQGKPTGAETPTNLDFALAYLPAGLTIQHVAGPSKWLCDGEGLSVTYEYTLDTPYGGGVLWAERAVWGRRALAIYAATDRVEPGSINGKPAIFVHPADDASGLGGQPLIVVIEDDTPPEFTILRIAGDQGIPFAELIKVAEGAR